MCSPYRRPAHGIRVWGRRCNRSIARCADRDVLTHSVRHARDLALMDIDQKGSVSEDYNMRTRHQTPCKHDEDQLQSTMLIIILSQVLSSSSLLSHDRDHGHDHDCYHYFFVALATNTTVANHTDQTLPTPLCTIKQHDLQAGWPGTAAEPRKSYSLAKFRRTICPW